MAQAWSASISTPVRSTVSTWVSTSTWSSSMAEVHEHRADQEGVAQRQQARGLLGRLDPCDPGHREHVALGDRARGDLGRRLRSMVDPTPGDGPAVRRLLGGDVDHPGTPERVEVRELGRHEQRV